MKSKLAVILFIFMAFAAYPAAWFTQNTELSVVFPDKVWNEIRAASQADVGGQRDKADEHLRRAMTRTEQARPFHPANWPEGWPEDVGAMEFLRYASPEAYIFRIVGDFAAYHNRTKEALNYYDLYIKNSIIPHTDYMMKMADMLEADGMRGRSRMLLEEIYKSLESGNFHGTEYSLSRLNSSMRELDMKMKVSEIYIMDINFINVPDFVKPEFRNLLIEKIKGLDVALISEDIFNRVLNEESIMRPDLKHVDELSRVGKIINADYMLRPSLIRHVPGGHYVFQVDVFDPRKASWFENYDYKTTDRSYLANMVSRFAYNFSGEDIPADLLLPVNRFFWNYEASGTVRDLAISRDGSRVVAGCETGSVYLLDGDGSQRSVFEIGEEIVSVAISPEGEHMAWMSLDGKLYFADSHNVIRWSANLRNQARGIDIASNGRFLVAGVNDKIFFKDSKGEVFWSATLSQWPTEIRISGDSRNIFVGMEGGAYRCFSDEGNLLWEKELGGRIMDIKVSETDRYNSVVTDMGRTFVFDRHGNEVLVFDMGQELPFSAFSEEVLRIVTGVRGGYVYFLSNEGRAIWRYDLRAKVNYARSLPDGSLVVTAEGRNISSFGIRWE